MTYFPTLIRTYMQSCKVALSVLKLLLVLYLFFWYYIMFCSILVT